MEKNVKDILEYHFPENLKAMSINELELLSYSIREFLIDKVSQTGGHLASNLGVVELTIALHKAFESPKDKMIWDVGHQSYVHKILTGRAPEFDTLRKYQGLSGFPKTTESPHDVFNTGHSSTSISAAAGLAAARDLCGENYEVIAIIGDGSLTGGMAYEALNNVGDSKRKLIVILNDNGMSISPNIGGISKHLGNLRTSKGYLNAKRFVKNKIGAIPSVGKGLAKGLADIKNDIKYSIMEKGGILFEELGFTYFGPIDGHDISALLDAFEKAKSLDEPIVIHVLTQKGKGYLNAEKEPGKFHGIGPFDKETGRILSACKQATYSTVMGEYLTEIGAKDKKIVAITAAMKEGTGLTKFSEKFPKRFFDVGIAEQHAVTFAAGLSKAGMKPFVCVYSSFLQRAYDQILHDVCLQKLPVIFMLDRAGVVGDDGETHNGVFDLSFLNSMPNMNILAPTSAEQLRTCMDYALTMDGPCAIRYPKGCAPLETELISKQNIIQDFSGSSEECKITILAVGKMYETATQVCTLLMEKGIFTKVYPIHIVKPIEEGLASYQLESEWIVTLEDNILSGGYGEKVKALFSETKKVISFAWPDQFIEQGNFEQLADKYSLVPKKIMERICESLERKA